MSLPINRIVVCRASATSVAVIMLVGALILGGCGIESIPFLEPVEQILPETDAVVFRHNTRNNIEDFLGYALFYKLYDSSGTPMIANDSLSVDAGTVGTTQLSQRGFVPVVPGVLTRREAGSSSAFVAVSPPIEGARFDPDIRAVSIPAVLFPRAVGTDFRVDMQQPPIDTAGQINVRWTAGSLEYRLELRRRSALEQLTAPSDYAGFWSAAAYDRFQYDLRQQLPQKATYASGDSLWMALYVVAYAQTVEGNRYFSAPRRLIVQVQHVQLQN